MTKFYRNQAGFTLMEVIAVAAISGTIALMSAPMVTDFKAKQSVSNAEEALVNSIKLAREAAISQGQIVSICPSADGLTCSTDWNSGWMVFAGSDAQSVRSESIIHSAKIDEPIDVGLFDEAPKSVVQFQFDANGFNLTAHRITATFCDEQQQISTLTLERTGRLLDASQHQNYQKSFLNSLQASASASKACTQV